MELKMKRPELEDRELLERYLAHADTRSCEMVFGNIYLWSRFYNTGFAIVEDNLIFGEVDGVYFQKARRKKLSSVNRRF